jgi:nucleotide-binding universal stress UspA family protein
MPGSTPSSAFLSPATLAVGVARRHDAAVARGEPARRQAIPQLRASLASPLRKRIRSLVMISRIAVGVDGSTTADKALEMAVDLARRFQADVVLLSALRDSKATSAGSAIDTVELDWVSNPSARVRHKLETTEAHLRAEGIACSTMVDEGDPGVVLVRLAEECRADLLVVGSKGMQRRVIGSVPNTVTHRADCSVLVVKTA